MSSGLGITYGRDYADTDAGPPWDEDKREDEAEIGYRFQPGGGFILDTPAQAEPLWGRGEHVLLADGEALVIAGPPGVAKTTVAQQVALGRCGLPEYTDLLGYPIQPGNRRCLYLAMDRPRQIARSFRRMVGEAMRSELDRRLAVWEGPPPFDFAKHTGLLTHMCKSADADTVVVDSLKDAAIGLRDDDVGAAYNRARQQAIAEGVQVVEIHHNRKTQQNTSSGSAPTIDDVYGSIWITAGAGSVLYFTGAPGDPITGLHHVKQPVAEVGPMKVIHDHDAGRSTVWHAADLVTVARRSPISAVEAAQAVFETDKPSAAEKEKARRRLEKLTASGALRVIDEGDRRANRPRLWGAA